MAVAAQNSQTLNNTTERHVDPNRLNQDGNLTGTAAWLRTEISGNIGESAVKVDKGQYEQADKLVGAETQQLLSKYVDVAGETDTDDDNGTAGEEPNTTQQLREAVDKQRRFVNVTRRYNRLYRNYTAANQNGNEQRARRFARRLNVLAENISRTGTRLQRNYTVLSEQTGTNFTTAATSVAAVNRTITNQQTRVRAVSFTETSLRIIPSNRQFSFRSPLLVRGRLATTNGSVISNRSVRIRISAGGPSERVNDSDLWERTVTTDDTGKFTLQYRPVTFPVDTQRLLITYQPRVTAPYVGSDTTIPANITQTEPTVSVSINRTDLQYGDQFTVTGKVTAANRSVPDVPVTARIDSYRISTNVTNQGGEFTATGRLPSTVEPGTRDVVAEVQLRGRAIDTASGTTHVSVSRRETRLNLSIDTPTAGTAVGSLTTGSGIPIPNKRIRIYADGRQIATGRTTDQGRYVITLPGLDDESSVEIAARFNATGTNLEPASARDVVGFSGGGGVWFVMFVALGAVSIAGGGLVIRRRNAGADESTTSTGVTSNEDPGDRLTDDQDNERPLLSEARDRLDEGEHRAAIELAYVGVRRTLGDDPNQSAATHWEFYHDVKPTLSPEHRTQLEELTSDYEAAIYGRMADQDTASSALADATELLDIDG